MAQKEYIVPTEIADAEFDIRFVSQKRRDEIAETNTRRMAGSLTGDLNLAKYQDEMADALIAGWRGVTRKTAMRLGYEDFDALPENGDGEVPYTVPTARKLYRFCLRDRFANEIDQVSRSILDALAREKKADSDSSETSSAPST